jgi:tetratricopeptide (TPR) repeat protein
MQPERKRYHEGVRYFLCAAAFALTLASGAQAGTYAVLPFFNTSKNTNLDWIGESLPAALQDALSAEGQMVVERDDRVEAYRRLSVRPYALLTRASVLKIGEELDAEHVIFGQFSVKTSADPGSKSRGAIEISARLLDLKGMRQGPEFRESGALEDLADLQSHLAWQTLRYANPQSALSEAAFRERHPPVRLDAIENFTRGLLATNPDEKHRLFTQAARLDARYSQPCFELGRLLWARKEYRLAADWFQKVSSTDAHFHQASFFLGLSRYYSGDFDAAQAAFQSVLSAVPLSEVYNDLGAAQSRSNRPAALESFRKALEGDRTDPAYQFNVGYVLWKSGNFEEAAGNFRAILDRDPTDADARLMLERCDKRAGPHSGDVHTEALERLKTNYEESAYLQLKAVLQPDKQ